MKPQNELAAILAKYSNAEGVSDTLIPGVYLFKATATDTPLPSVYDPCVNFLAQGKKRVLLNNEVYYYSPSKYLVISVDLPMLGIITEASEDEPFLAIKINFDLQQLSELLIHNGLPEKNSRPSGRGLCVGEMDAKLGESVLRLARLLESPEDIPVLAAQMQREIFYRLLRSDYGANVSQIVQRGSNIQRVATAIQKIKTGFNKSISVEALAETAGMSVSSFHAHFKAVTAMSPLQYQKTLRLMEARGLMVTGKMDAATTAYRVGYESASQFSREYARMFGNPPRRDVSSLN